jgi:imidazolonepropionase-like amidohydrolase
MPRATPPFLLPVLAASLWLAALPASAQTTDRYVIIQSGETVGHLHATRDGNRVEIDYDVDSNGRGAGNRQVIELGPDAIPVSWTIEGHSLFGDPVEESMRWSGGTQHWQSQSESGAVETETPHLYIANDDSPWSQGLYARAILASGGDRLSVLPAGTVQLDEIDLPEALPGLPDARIVRLTGLGLEPSYIVLDGRDRLIANFGGGMTILEEHAGLAPQLRQWRSNLENERLIALTEALTHDFDVPVTLRNVRIFDPDSGTVGSAAAVTVFGGEIVAIQPNGDAWIGEDHAVIDGEGGVLVPGLHDMHAHIGPHTGLRYLSAGVTSVRDQGNSPEGILRLTDRIERGELAGPRTVRNGMIEGRSDYSVRTGTIAETLEDALEAVRWYATHGYFQIKIYNSVPGDWIEPMIAEARAWNLGVSGHVPAFVSPDFAIEAGYDDIAHINQLMLGWLLEEGEDTRTPIRLTGMRRAASLDLDTPAVHETIRLMREHGTAVDTTAVTLELLMLSRSGEFSSSSRGHVEHMPIGFQRHRRRAFVTIETPEDDAEYRDAFQRLLDTLYLLDSNGIQLLPGTDNSNAFPVHRELELYVEAGLTPARALALGTLEAERFLGRDAWLGSIEVGKRADFFLTAGNPLEDISQIRRIRMVMKDGAVYLPAEIHDRLGIVPFAEPVALPASGGADDGGADE